MKMVCNVIRGKEVESSHEIYAVALDEDGKIITQSDPYFKEHDEPQPGNRLLLNLRSIREFLEELVEM